jgi:diketogulonate reductase-like aldo/keto reductase
MAKNIHSTVELNNGIEMPYFGLGTFQSKGDSCTHAVEYALSIKYDMIDTAQAYENENRVAKGWKASGRSRESFFLTTKVWNKNQGYESAKQSVKQSLIELETDYVDLLLIHWPNVTDFSRTIDTWRAMVEMQQAGLTRSIGVSNFTIKLLNDLLAQTDVVPTINQVEFHIFLYQKELLDFCRGKGIQIEAYSPLARAEFLDNDVLWKIAKKHDKTTAQVMLAWLLHHDIVIIPKSVHKNRIAENAEVFFDLDDDDMHTLDALNRNQRIINPPWAPDW